MDLIRRLVVLVGCLFLAASPAPAADEPKPPFALSLVPGRSNSRERSISTAGSPPRVFYVVLTNVSDRPQPVWETWCSWGYRAISFEITLPDGKQISLTMKPQRFTKNYPSVFIVPPGERQVYPVQLDDAWDHVPASDATGDTPVTCKAIYSVSPTPEATAHGVWAGRTESVGYSVVFRP